MDDGIYVGVGFLLFVFLDLCIDFDIVYLFGKFVGLVC